MRDWKPYGTYGKLELYDDSISGEVYDVLGKVIKKIDEYWLFTDFQLKENKSKGVANFYIGSTGTDFRKRASKHGKDGKYDLMVVVYKARSFKRAWQMEDQLNMHYLNYSDNVREGSGGRKAINRNLYKYVYVLFKLK